MILLRWYNIWNREEKEWNSYKSLILFVYLRGPFSKWRKSKHPYINVFGPFIHINGLNRLRCISLKKWGLTKLLLSIYHISPRPMTRVNTATFVTCWQPLQIVWNQIRTNILDPNRLTLILFLKEFFEKVNFEKRTKSQTSLDKLNWLNPKSTDHDFVWFDSLRPINNLSVIKGRVFLGEPVLS